MEAMQDTANEHCRLIHIGRDDLAKRGLSWVLFKVELQIEQYPRLDQKVTIRTFTKGSRFKFCPRYYIIRNQEGQEICKAGALWMIMDMRSRTTLIPQKCGIEPPNEQYNGVPLQISTASKMIEGAKKIFDYQPVYSEIDLNGHVNNVRYADWLCNDLGLDLLREKEIQSLSINYNYEILPGVAVKHYLIMKDDEFQFIGRADDTQFFSMYGVLRNKQTNGEGRQIIES